MTPIAFLMEPDHLRIFEPGEEKKNTQGHYYLVDTLTWKDGVDESSLCRRGWVTQERALSVQTLHFGQHQLYWECRTENASEVFPKGLLSGTVIKDPKIFLVPRTEGDAERTEKLHAVRQSILESRKRDEEFRMRWECYLSIHDRRVEQGESDDEVSDTEFARRMKAIQTSGQLSTEIWSESSDSGTETESGSFAPSIKYLGLYPGQFDGCDLNILDGLEIKGWKKFKMELKSLGFGTSSNRVKPLNFRGMSFEQCQWAAVVGLFSRCSLSFSQDKLVAISGMAELISKTMNCAYLAGLWRKDLEHQLLWKVKRVLSAPKKDGTRGPSWPWASVDGEIEIPAWSGYRFEDPGDISWLARVNNVSIQLATTGEFGQVQFGDLSITGCLGVFNIDKEKLDDPFE